MRALNPFTGPTVASVMDRHRGGPGFDFMRIALSMCLVLWHTNLITSGYDAALWQAWYLRPFLVAILPVFFALSGFLVTGSALRTRNVRRFMVFRILRLTPALATEITLSALILGPLVTDLPLRAYFSDPGFFRYFGALVGWVQFSLPGVFVDNPSHIVNANLWTLRPEFFCYVIMATLMISGIAYNRRRLTWLFAASHLCFVAFFLFPSLHYGATARFVRSSTLCYCFLLGSVMYHWKDRIPLNRMLLVLCLIGAIAGLGHDVTTIPACICAAYCTVYAGMIAIPPLPLLRRGDYSYGVYLYGFPITQALYHFFPLLHARLPLFAAAAPATILFSMLSWHLVEKPCLGLKRHLEGRKSVRAADVSFATAPSKAESLRA